MREQLEQRLQALKEEFEVGQNLLADIEKREVNLKSSLLRISGAIQVLEELLSQEPEALAESRETETPQVATR